MKVKPALLPAILFGAEPTRVKMSFRSNSLSLWGTPQLCFLSVHCSAVQAVCGEVTAARGAVGKFKIPTPLDCLAKSVLSHAPPHISTHPGRKRVIEKTGKFSSLAFPRRGLTKRLVHLLVCWTKWISNLGLQGVNYCLKPPSKQLINSWIWGDYNYFVHDVCFQEKIRYNNAPHSDP